MMKSEINKIMIDNMREVELLQNVAEIAIACGDCTDEEKAIAKEFSRMLEDMLHSKKP